MPTVQNFMSMQWRIRIVVFTLFISSCSVSAPIILWRGESPDDTYFIPKPSTVAFTSSQVAFHPNASNPFHSTNTASGIVLSRYGRYLVDERMNSFRLRPNTELYRLMEYQTAEKVLSDLRTWFHPGSLDPNGWLRYSPHGISREDQQRASNIIFERIVGGHIDAHTFSTLYDDESSYGSEADYLSDDEDDDNDWRLRNFLGSPLLSTSYNSEIAARYTSGMTHENNLNSSMILRINEDSRNGILATGFGRRQTQNHTLLLEDLGRWISGLPTGLEPYGVSEAEILLVGGAYVSATYTPSVGIFGNPHPRSAGQIARLFPDLMYSQHVPHDLPIDITDGDDDFVPVLRTLFPASHHLNALGPIPPSFP